MDISFVYQKKLQSKDNFYVRNNTVNPDAQIIYFHPQPTFFTSLSSYSCSTASILLLFLSSSSLLLQKTHIVSDSVGFV